MHVFTLGSDGYFRRDGSPFVPVGVNYWPASCVDDQEMWARWPGKEIQADLAQIAASGLNAVRVDAPAVEAYRVYAEEFVRLGAAAGLAVLVAGTDALVRDGGMPARTLENVQFSARPGTHVLPHDGLLDPFFHQFLPFAVAWGRLKLPTIVAAFGFGEPAGIRQRDTCLRAMLPAAREAGAAGFFWRGWRDTRAFSDGLFDAAGALKPGLEFFREFVREPIAGGAPAASPDTIALYARREVTTTVESPRRLLLARHLMRCAGKSTLVVAGTATAGACRRVLIPGIAAGAADAPGLLRWVRDGGELFWHGPDLLTWNADLEALLGARPVDWRSARGISVNAFGERFTFAHFPHDVRAELEPCGAKVLARDQQEFPVLLENQVGRGRVRYVLPMVEEAIVPVAAHPAARDRWAAWYRGMFEAAG